MIEKKINQLTKRIIDSKIQKLFENSLTQESFDDILNHMQKTSGSRKYKFVDAHLHVVDFNQETMGLAKLISYMDSANIDSAVIFGLPVAKIWEENEQHKPDYYLDDDNPCYYHSNTDYIVATQYNKLSEEKQSRLFPMICGFNPMDINAVNHIKNTLENNRGVFCGIGEILYRHDDLSFQIYGSPPRMNTKATEKILEFASWYDLPVMIHNNISSPGVSDYPKFLHEFETILRKYPKATIIFAHAGASRRIYAPYYVKMIDRLMSEYENLYIDLSWVVYDDIICSSEESMQDWVKLCEKHNTRIMVGTDLLGQGFHKIGYVMSRYEIFFDMMSDLTAKNIGSENARKLFTQAKERVKNNFKRTFPDLNEFEL